MDITVFSLPVCPNCDAFKQTLHDHHIPYKSLDLEDDNVRMDLLMDCVTLVEAPIIKIGDNYYDAESAYKELNVCV